MFGFRKVEKINRIFRFFLVFFIIFGWIFSGWPRAWNNPLIPPGIQKAKAYNDVVSNLNPNYRWLLDGDENDSVDSADSDGGTNPSWVSNIIPNSESSQCGDYNNSSRTNIPNKSNINSSVTYQKSISVWVDIDTIDTSYNGRVIWGEGGSSNGLVLYVYSGSLYFLVYESSNRDYVSYPVSTGTLYHIGAVLDSTHGEMHLYLDGVEVASKTGGLNISTSFSAHSAGAAIGGYDSALKNHSGTSMTGYAYFDGRISDVAYWAEVVLDVDDFSAIYNAGANLPPSLTVSQPDGTGDTLTVGDSYDITYDLSDSEDEATVDFYYDSDSSGEDGTAITDCQNQAEGTGATCSWDTTGMTPGSYYVYGVATDGVNSNVVDYSPGQITINSAVSVSITLDPGSGTVTYGTVATSQDTTSSGVNQTQTVRNTGNVAEDFDIKGQNSANWTLGASAGNAVYKHEWCTQDCDGTPTWNVLTTTYNANYLSTNVPVDNTVDFDLNITVPTSNPGTSQQSVDVFIQATQH